MLVTTPAGRVCGRVYRNALSERVDPPRGPGDASGVASTDPIVVGMRAFAVLLSVVVALLLLAVFTPEPASAEYRSGMEGDGRDAAETIDGSPRREDVEQVRANYDSAGSIQAVVRFFDPLPAHSSYHFVIYFGSGGRGSNGGCSSSNPGDPYLRFELGSDTPELSGGAWMGVHGYEGITPARHVFSADGREVFVQASHASIADRALACTDGGAMEITARSCRYCSTSRTTVVDEVSPFDLSGGSAPEPFPARAQCADGLDNDGDGVLDRQDGDCGDPEDPTERPPACRDGADNDGDRQFDRRDWGCADEDDDDERLTDSPTLAGTAATEALRRQLVRRLGASFQPRTFRRSCERTSRHRVVCRVRWRTLRFRFSGVLSITSRRLAETPMIGVRGTLLRTALDCPHRSRRTCRKSLRVDSAAAMPGRPPAR